MKYELLTTTGNQLKEKAENEELGGLGGMTLTELMQLEYVGQRLLNLDILAQQAHMAAKTKMTVPQEPASEGQESGQYL